MRLALGGFVEGVLLLTAYARNGTPKTPCMTVTLGLKYQRVYSLLSSVTLMLSGVESWLRMIVCRPMKYTSPLATPHIRTSDGIVLRLRYILCRMRLVSFESMTGETASLALSPLNLLSGCWSQGRISASSIAGLSAL